MPEPLTMTVDVATRRRMVRELWLRDVRSLRTRLVLGTVVAGWVVLVLSHNVLIALAAAGLLLLGRVTWWWVRLTRKLTKRLPAGQSVSVGHTVDGDVVIRDAGEVWLPRGSAISVERVGSTTLVYGRTMGAVVPTALLTDEDAAFLEGHGTKVPVRATTEAPPDLPMSVEITPQVQTDLVRARRRSYLRSGQFGIGVVSALLVLGVMATVARPQTLLVVLVVISIPITLGLVGMEQSCAALRRAFPVGHLLRAGADEDGLVLTMVHGALRLRWSEAEGHRLRERTVELRTRKGRPLGNVTLPRGLFSPVSLQLLTAAVPRTF